MRFNQLERASVADLQTFAEKKGLVDIRACSRFELAVRLAVVMKPALIRTDLV